MSSFVLLFHLFSLAGMQHEKFRKVVMVAALGGLGLTIQTPAGAGDKTQFLPATLADNMKAAERADQALPEAERQRLYYKNGIQSIGSEDYYAHTVKTPSGVMVTEYRLDAPVDATPAPAPAPVPTFDPNQMAAAMGQAMAQTLHSMSQAQDARQAQGSAQDDDQDDDQTPPPPATQPAGPPAPVEPSAATKATDQAPPAQTPEAQAAGLKSDATEQPLSTTVNNAAAGESAEGSIQPDSTAGTDQKLGDNGTAGTDQAKLAGDGTAADSANKTAAQPAAAKKAAPGQSGKPGRTAVAG